MKWYFAMNERGIVRYGQMIAAACRSAAVNTTLSPNMLYDGLPNAFTEYLRGEGVNIINTKVSFIEQLTKARPGGGFDPEVAKGAYLRLEVSNVELEDEYILYTDADVIFAREPNISDCKPQIFAACPEVWTGGESPGFVDTVFNSGVMLMNTVAFRSQYDDLVAFSEKNDFYFHGNAGYYDQGALNHYFEGKWEKLDANLNCRPFIGDLQKGQIIHFHGTKPYEIDLLVRKRFDEVPPEAKKLYDWAPKAYDDVMSIFKEYIPEWWAEYARNESRPHFEVKM